MAQTSVDSNPFYVSLWSSIDGLFGIVFVVLAMVLESATTIEGSVSPRVIADQLGSYLRTPAPFNF